MATTFMHRTAHDTIEITRVRSAFRGVVTRHTPEPVVNAGRWATGPGEYAGPRNAPTDLTLPVIAAPGVTDAIACGRCGPVILHLAGTWAGRVVFEGSVDGEAWERLSLAPFTGDTAATETDRPGLWRMFPGERMRFMRLRVLHLRRGAIQAAIAAAPAVAQPALDALDSAA